MYCIPKCTRWQQNSIRASANESNAGWLKSSYKNMLIFENSVLCYFCVQDIQKQFTNDKYHAIYHIALPRVTVLHMKDSSYCGLLVRGVFLLILLLY